MVAYKAPQYINSKYFFQAWQVLSLPSALANVDIKNIEKSGRTRNDIYKIINFINSTHNIYYRCDGAKPINP
jgi:hypothetical protein